MREPPRDAAQWLPAARAGSAEALGQLLEACRGYLLMIAQEELDPELRAKGGASDLVQETCLKAQRGFDGFGGQTESELLAWLRRLLLNNLIDFTRQYRATDKRQVGREVPLQAESSADGPRVEAVADQSSPSGQAMAHERDDALHRAIERLPEDYRTVLRLRYEEERSFEEIGQRLGRSASAVRKLWARAVERLQEDLDA